MWIWMKEYIALRERAAKQETTIVWLQHQINMQLRDLAILKSKQLGIPELVVPQIEVGDPTIVAPLPPPVAPNRAADPKEEEPTMEDLMRGNIDMEDMGDARAAKEGIGWDPVTGTVRYANQ